MMADAKIPYSLNSKAVAEATKVWMQKRGVTVTEIAELVMLLQKNYYPNLTMEECVHNVEMVLSKREVQNAVLTLHPAGCTGRGRQAAYPAAGHD